ncbi:hypothetical protein ACLKA6_000591 [Drosophila palustris]
MTDEQLDVRMDFLNKTESTFTLTHDSLEELDYDEIGSQLRQDFEELIINIKSVVLREIRKRQTQTGPCSTSTMRREPNIEGSTTIIHQRKSNVPELKLPEFSGGYTETFPVALTGDICKMYRCVRMNESDSFLQCILWRDSPQQEVQIYKLDTVTYGTKPASFLSVRAMQQLASDEKSSFPIGSKILMRDFYVDDLISGGDSTQEALEIMRQVTSLLDRGQFKLRKWCSNDPAVLQQIPDSEKETFLKFDDGSDITKTLGLAWDPVSDDLLFAFSPLQSPSKPSKRTVLSTIARFYDPLGLICPAITKAKIFLQQLWREKLDWDESLPSSLNSSWLTLSADLGRTQQLRFPRRAHLPKSAVEIHGFCDASIDAFGGCIYIVSMAEGRRTAQLLCAKSRVAPLKTLTLIKQTLRQWKNSIENFNNSFVLKGMLKWRSSILGVKKLCLRMT